MGALISEKQKKHILGLQGSAVTFGVLAIVLGVLLRMRYMAVGYATPIIVIPEVTDGYYGVVSGSLVGFLGVFGWAIIISRQVNMVVLYFFLLLACDASCLFDLLMVVPQVIARGHFAWAIKSSFCNVHTGYRQIDDSIDKECEELRIHAILLICITATVALASLLTLVTTFKTGFALCQAGPEASTVHPPAVELAPVQTAQGYVNTQFEVSQEGQQYY